MYRRPSATKRSDGFPSPESSIRDSVPSRSSSSAQWWVSAWSVSADFLSFLMSPMAVSGYVGRHELNRRFGDG